STVVAGIMSSKRVQEMGKEEKPKRSPTPKPKKPVEEEMYAEVEQVEQPAE
ncbi:MAG: hypothetical protein GTN37_01165, partial [Candidatus Aenigmarchaeota archaeon]|nr:hypothetical protein [Candidatus Aenigmarchaeota archaeon]